jgi:hypothetical protein
MLKKEIKKKSTYIFPRKLFATFIGFIGIMLMLSKLSITGAAIGGGTDLTVGIIGVLFLLFALLLYVKPSKKKL